MQETGFSFCSISNLCRRLVNRFPIAQLQRE